MGFRMPLTAVIFDRKLPHPLHVLPHDLHGVAGTVVGGDRVRAVSKDCHGDGLRAASVPELVLHPVA